MHVFSCEADVQVGRVYKPPLTGFSTPIDPYPVPDVPALYPAYYTTPSGHILPNLSFPPDFLFGWATAAQQYEGAVQADGKGPTTWVSMFLQGESELI